MTDLARDSGPIVPEFVLWHGFLSLKGVQHDSFKGKRCGG